MMFIQGCVAIQCRLYSVACWQGCVAIQCCLYSVACWQGCVAIQCCLYSVAWWQLLWHRVLVCLMFHVSFKQEFIQVHNTNTKFMSTPTSLEACNYVRCSFTYFPRKKKHKHADRIFVPYSVSVTELHVDRAVLPCSVGVYNIACWQGCVAIQCHLIILYSVLHVYNASI